MNRMARLRSCVLAACVVTIANNAQAAAETPLEATTEDGRKVILHPDGRWEFGPSDAARAPAANQAAPAKAAAPAAGGTASAATPSDDRYCQGGLFGVGRRICPGDPGYNRGSLNPKLR
jgi:hypothetical protein